jgi:hypothetical protein
MWGKKQKDGGWWVMMAHGSGSGLTLVPVNCYIFAFYFVRMSAILA